MKRFHFLLLLAWGFLQSGCVYAQSVTVGSTFLEEGYRRGQLLGALDPEVSLTIRPVSPVQAFGVTNSFDPDGSLAQTRFTRGNGIYRMGWEGWEGQGFAFSLQALPIERFTQYVSDYPFSLNDGGMIPAVGLQTLTRIGVYGEIGFFKNLGLEGISKGQGLTLSIQLAPEFVSAENKEFSGFPLEHRDDIWTQYYMMHSKIDWPERYGDTPYSKLSWGQSNVALKAGPLSIGVSNENLWWGPGMRNALLMTNTAPGFKHFTFNTIRPIKTFMGSLEFQLVSGNLNNSGYRINVPDSTNYGFVNYYSKPLPVDTVYFNGVVFSYQPKWLPGLFLGATRSFQTYRSTMGDTFRDYFPVILPLSKSSSGEAEEDKAERNQLASFFIRWMMPESHAEVYMEFGRDDHAWNLRDLFLEPFHSRAYLVGFRKLIVFKKPNTGGLEFAFEHTNLQLASSAQYRSTGPWYLHSQIRQGYTNEGQMLGAGVGPGGGMQTLQVSWLVPGSSSDATSLVPGGTDFRPAPINRDGLRPHDSWRSVNGGSLGIVFERFVHNDDFHYEAIKDVRAHWVDWDIGFRGQVAFKNFVFDLKLDFVTSLNYQHLYEPAVVIDPWWNPGINTFNFIGGLGITYRF